MKWVLLNKKSYNSSTLVLHNPYTQFISINLSIQKTLMKLGLLGLKSYNLEICSYILIYFKFLLSLISSKQFLPVEGFHTLGWSTVTALAAVCCRTDGFYAILLSRFSNILLLHSVQFCLFFWLEFRSELFKNSSVICFYYDKNYWRWNLICWQMLSCEQKQMTAEFFKYSGQKSSRLHLIWFILLKRIVSYCTFETWRKLSIN